MFAVYDKRKSDIDERLIDIKDLEEAVKVVTAQKRPQKDTPYEDLAMILGDDYRMWRKTINMKEIEETLNEPKS